VKHFAVAIFPGAEACSIEFLGEMGGRKGEIKEAHTSLLIPK
jgi:hypothetical protein